MSPLKQTNSLPTDTKVCVFDAMRGFRLIQRQTIQTPRFMKWVETVKIYFEHLSENTLNAVLNDYSPGQENIFKRIAYKV